MTLHSASYAVHKTIKLRGISTFCCRNFPMITLSEEKPTRFCSRTNWSHSNMEPHQDRAVIHKGLIRVLPEKKDEEEIRVAPEPGSA